MREIIESEAFAAAVAALGGYRAIDRALDLIREGLYLNPYGFPKFENDWVSFRYARTRGIDFIPPLVFIFSIDNNGDVILEYVEEDPGSQISAFRKATLPENGAANTHMSGAEPDRERKIRAHAHRQ
jgi:hypothetical protein